MDHTLCDSLASSVGRTCDLLLTSKLWDITLMVTFHYIRPT